MEGSRGEDTLVGETVSTALSDLVSEVVLQFKAAILRFPNRSFRARLLCLVFEVQGLTRILGMVREGGDISDIFDRDWHREMVCLVRSSAGCDGRPGGGTRVVSWVLDDNEPETEP